MIVNIHFSNFDKKLKYDFDENIKIIEIKENIEKEENMPFNKNEIKLIFSGRIIPNDKSLKDIKFISGNTFSALGKKIIQETTTQEMTIQENIVQENIVQENIVQENIVQDNNINQLLNFVTSFINTINSVESEIINQNNLEELDIESIQQDFMEKIEQMKEMGLTDVNRCKLCLTLSGGNVEMAINLYYEMNIGIIQSDNEDDLEGDESEDD